MPKKNQKKSRKKKDKKKQEGKEKKKKNFTYLVPRTGIGPLRHRVAPCEKPDIPRGSSF